MPRKYRRDFLPRFFRTSRRELDDEFRFHLRMRAAELERSGLSAEAARAEALRQFGDVDDARNYCSAEDRRRARASRRGAWLHDLRLDVAVAARSFWRDPAYTFTTVVVLAVAIAIATSAYGLAHAYLVRPLPYPEPERLVQVIAGPSRGPFPNAPSLARVEWEPVNAVFDATVAWDLDGFTLAGDERPDYVDGAWVSPGYFSALGMQPAVGRGFTPDEYAARGAPVAIISDELWSRRYHRDRAVIGRAIRVHSTDRPNENALVTIVGVMPAGVWHVSRFTDVLRPLTTSRMPSIARLPARVSIADAERRMNAAVLPQLGVVDPAWRMSLVTVQDEYTEAVRPILVSLLGAAGFLLLIGGASVAGAQVARASARRAEVQVRVALGAGRGRIARQLLAENTVLAGVAAIIGVMLANVALGAAGPIVGEQLRAAVPGGPDQLAPDRAILALAILVGTTIGVAFGVIPAMLAAKTDATLALRNASGGTLRASAPARLRRTLIAAQVAFTMMLLVGAGLMARTVMAIADVPLGFDETNVIKGTLLMPLSRYPDAGSRLRGADKILAALETTPGIRSAALASPFPFRGGMPAIPIAPEGQTQQGDGGPRAVQYVVTPGYFAVMGIGILSGRSFDERERQESAPVTIVSAELARRLWPNGDAVGKRIRAGRDTVWRTVVGVARDTREVVSSEQQPDIYLPYAHVPRAYVSVLTRAAAASEALLPVLPKLVGRVDDVLALAEVEPMSAVVARDGQRHRALAVVLGTFATFALGLAVLGLYSALAYVVAQRRREIAIRSAVGASGRSIARLVLGEGIPLMVAGLFVGTGLSLALTRALRSQLYGVTVTDLPTFLGIAAVLAVAGLGALLVPMRQAMRVDPATVLRSE